MGLRVVIVLHLAGVQLHFCAELLDSDVWSMQHRLIKVYAGKPGISDPVEAGGRPWPSC